MGLLKQLQDWEELDLEEKDKLTKDIVFGSNMERIRSIIRLEALKGEAIEGIKSVAIMDITEIFLPHFEAELKEGGFDAKVVDNVLHVSWVAFEVPCKVEQDLGEELPVVKSDDLIQEEKQQALIKELEDKIKDVARQVDYITKLQNELVVKLYNK